MDQERDKLNFINMESKPDVGTPLIVNETGGVPVKRSKFATALALRMFELLIANSVAKTGFRIDLVYVFIIFVAMCLDLGTIASIFYQTTIPTNTIGCCASVEKDKDCVSRFEQFEKNQEVAAISVFSRDSKTGFCTLELPGMNQIVCDRYGDNAGGMQLPDCTAPELEKTADLTLRHFDYALWAKMAILVVKFGASAVNALYFAQISLMTEAQLTASRWTHRLRRLALLVSVILSTTLTAIERSVTSTDLPTTPDSPIRILVITHLSQFLSPLASTIFSVITLTTEIGHSLLVCWKPQWWPAAEAKKERKAAKKDRKVPQDMSRRERRRERRSKK